MSGVQVLERVQRLALPTYLRLHARHRHARNPRHRELAHAHAVVERREALGERVLERRHDQDIVDLVAGEDEDAGHDVGDMGRVEATAEDRDARLRPGV